MSRYEWGPYVSVGDRIAYAAENLQKLRKKDPGVAPVALQGKALAKTWWGKAWNANLEGYADYANRIQRGSAYIRRGAVIDLRIHPGKVTAVVQGSRKKPYEVEISIRELSPAVWKRVTGACRNQINSLQDLLAGKFPEAMGKEFMSRNGGLFPAPAEIRFSCSCPDWASMCKHVAAALYGVGARLDQDPALFFTLRNVDVGGLVKSSATAAADALLGRAGKGAGRILEGPGIEDLFGIEMDAGAPVPVPLALTKKTVPQEEKAKAKAPEPVAATARVETKAAEAARIRTLREQARAKRAGEDAAPEPLKRGGRARTGKTEEDTARAPSLAKKAGKTGGKTQEEKEHGKAKAAMPGKTGKPAAKAGKAEEKSEPETVYAIVNRHVYGIDIPSLVEHTGLDRQKVSNILARLVAQGRIRRVDRGRYGKKAKT
jgi:uncharacterized Zn finger protein